MNNFLFVTLIACCVGGCCPRADKPAQKEPPKKSVVREAIEGATGKTATEDLKRAKPKIEAAGKTEQQKQQDIDELTKP